MNAEIKTCHPCKETHASKFQDQTYGKGMRVHNAMKAPGKYRCTICGNVKG